MVSAIIFDLDSCLSAADEPGRDFYDSVFAAVTCANTGTHTAEALDQAFADMWRLPFDFVARKYRFTERMLQAGWAELVKLEVTTPMLGYGDLHALAELLVRRLLVTSGFRRLQESKIRALGIAPLFTAIVIDAIDEPNPRGKQPIFEDLIRTHQLKPSGTLIVGDNPDSELAAGRRLGIRTVQTLRPGVPRDPQATHHIQSLHELKQLMTP